MVFLTRPFWPGFGCRPGFSFFKIPEILPEFSNFRVQFFPGAPKLSEKPLLIIKNYNLYQNSKNNPYI
jgi:hypothetical protein